MSGIIVEGMEKGKGDLFGTLSTADSAVSMDKFG